MITLDDLLATRRVGVRNAYDDRDAMLYALSLGVGADPLDAGDLRFVYEGAGLAVMPTMAVVLAPTGIVARIGIPMRDMLHAGQRLVLHRPLPPGGSVVADARVSRVADRGSGRGALVTLLTEARLESDGQPLFASEMVVLARSLGGIGSANVMSDPAGEGDPADPPERTVTLPTRPDAALLYRLNGDRNPLHADPAVARAAGFPRPVLHGLCTYGMAARALLATGADPQAIAGFNVRFSAPVFPGDTLAFDLWDRAAETLFICRAIERDVTVLRQGRCRWR